MRRFVPCIACGFLVALAGFIAAPSPASACDILVEDAAAVSLLSFDAEVLVVRDRGVAVRSLVVPRSSVLGGVVVLEERAVVVRRQRAARVRLFPGARAARRAIVVR